MTTATQLPLTNLELATIGGAELVRFPISFEEYWELLEKAEYRVDYNDHEAIAMSYENETHSEMVTEFSHLLKGIFPRTNTQYKVHNSNRPIYIVECESAVYNPDGSVVTQPPVYFEYRPGMTAETTPFLVFEVLSKSTRRYDLGEKLPCYKKIPSLQYILYIDLDRPSVAVFERQSTQSWIEVEYTKLEDSFEIQGNALRLKDIYLNLFA
ncbi:Uma2 family endonuclease [Haliscomenobacter hydrossis]|uniref:Putative restriction endonuclease domain-containing protein n=1 Tax=Haliscomenobacter hydrossis (strain ATCC 27775 / DSM 1100 / LMG 10767 / O) TaxID=760192 RepID=F4L4J1_HALH1|nr:Uma2 family endonuclease [Haliscomenobacter hydrossis]AEE51992.1 protein of unknown function DUF820 [Haliscomenobacter hydrossis DSM 1100]